MKIGIIGIRNGWSSEQLADALARRTGERTLIEMNRVSFDVVNDRLKWGELALNDFDALIVKKIGENYSPDLLNRLYLLDHLQRTSRVKIFSAPDSMLRAIDRMRGTMALRSAGLPMPATFITEDIDDAIAAVEAFGKAVLKPLFTSKARGMILVEPGPNLRSEVENYKAAGNQVIYIQQFIDIPGQDLGIAFLGGEYLATYARVAGGTSWNTTILAGGRYQQVEPAAEIIEIARRAQAVFRLDFTSVDIAITRNGPMVFEVSAFGGFRGLYDACGIDAAELYLNYVVSHIEKSHVPAHA